MALGGVFAAIKKAGLHKPFVWLWKYVVGNAIENWFSNTLEAKLEPILKTQAELKAQILPNGGSSLRDAVNRTEQAVNALSDRATALEARVGELERK